MSIEQMIDNLRVYNVLLVFDTKTGLYKNPDELDDQEQTCYYTHEEVIKVLQQVQTLIDNVY